MYLRMPKHPKQNRPSATLPLNAVEPPWAEEEFKTLDLGDPRREKRVRQMAGDFFANMGRTIPQASAGWAGAKAAYRCLDNEAVTPVAILAAHRAASLARAETEAVVLVVQDTTTVNLSTQPQTRGLGPISNNPGKTLGYFLHASLALGESGAVLGVLDVQTWARDPKQFKRKSSVVRNRQALEEKESIKWQRSVEATQAAALATPGPRKLWINVADREGDCYEVYWRAQHWRQQTGEQVHLLVRMQHDREVDGETDRLFAHLQRQPVALTWSLQVPAQPGRAARTAVLTLRFTQVSLPPSVQARKYLGRTEAVTLWALSACEEHPPTGVAPLHWRLLTTQAVTTADDALTQVRRYSQRWTIELFHKILKSGCRIEARQLETLPRLLRCLQLDVIVAWRVLALSRAGRGDLGALPITQWLTDLEWQLLWVHHHRTGPPPAQPPTTRQAVRWIAQLGGFLARKHDGEPGLLTLWRGLQRLHDFVHLAQNLPSPRQTCG
jgi:hypothetical protein